MGKIAVTHSSEGLHRLERKLSVLAKFAACSLIAVFLGWAGLAYAGESAALEVCSGDHFQTVLHDNSSQYPARAYWLDRQLIQWPGVQESGKFRIYYSARGQIKAAIGTKVAGADGTLALEVFSGSLPAALATRFKFVGAGAVLKIADADRVRMSELHKRQMLLVQENAEGEVLKLAALQAAGALDDIYASAKKIDDLGVSIRAKTTRFQLWAPTAQAVALCLYDKANGAPYAIDAMQWNVRSGAWSLSKAADLSGGYYLYVVDVFVPGVGMVRNRVTDPYAISLSADSLRSYIANLDADRLMPKGWRNHANAAPRKLRAQTDMAVYELHVRDFSINDSSVSAAHRGKYLAFTEAASNGMQHLRALAKAGMTDVHLLPVFDFASVPETACLSPALASQADSASELPQAAIGVIAARDCYNWGYDPFHYNAPEGSYASDATDGARRILELRQMVMALHAAGLRVGMDVVYNHTDSSGQTAKSVLDRIVPAYYHRLNANGDVEQSTCTPCGNTATENAMMGKLMVDSVLLWARQYQIDSFRFDLMAHQPRAVMEELKAKLKAQRGRDIELIGEGWNFGEVADGARFVQASQLSLNGSGIGTFSDRGRDAVRGGGAGDSGASLISRKGYINGLADSGSSRLELLKAADMVRVGLAGSLRDYSMQTYDGSRKTLSQIDYAGQPAGYVSAPGEVVNYVENHDNQTLFDINAYKLPPDTSREDRVRVQMLGAAITAFSQGVAYFHAGLDVLRSKSMDRNSYNSGDWFNRLDWGYQDNYFATGLPPKADNGDAYPMIAPLLESALIKPGAAEIMLARDMFLDLLRIRASSSLLRMRSAADVAARLHFENLGPQQNGAVIVAQLDGKNYADANFQSVMYFINVAASAQTLDIGSAKGQAYVLHPVHTSADVADKRIAAAASFDPVSGRFILPARSAVMFVRR
ncbi:DUF3372 domain-containing protein [Undibacterium piscinae]|uniref:DUF3372 domain-containing protein n=1 Tax=Undibacterium piscinae TaxID=2495591 RepID=A0A6M4A9V7_9BURK|nr:DUF3372 domain-containing protein [Undibacterium piscinae]